MLFHVKGSGSATYQLKSTGEGPTFYLSCSCPAGRRIGRQCKHARALLLGDVTALLDGSSDVVDLAKRAKGSPALAEATNRPLKSIPNRPPVGVIGIKSLFEANCPRILATGLIPQHSETDEAWRVNCLSLHGQFKNGKVKKGADFELSWEELSGDLVVQEDGTTALVNLKSRDRPYIVRGRGVSTVTRKRFEDAYDVLTKMISKAG